MNSNHELKPGWLKFDLERASKRVQELKIAKSKFTVTPDEESKEAPSESDREDSSDILHC